MLYQIYIETHTHTSLIHSSINGHISCFHILATVNNAPMNTRCIYLLILLFSFSWSKYPEMEYWVVWLFSCLIFEKLSYCFPYWLHHFTFQSEVSLESLSSTSAPAFVIYKFLMMSLVTRERWYRWVVLICFSLIVNDVEHLLSTCWLSVYLLWLSCVSFLHILDINFLSDVSFALSSVSILGESYTKFLPLWHTL